MSDLISRAEAVDVLSLGKEILSRVLDDIDVVSTDREKYSWGLELIESIIKDIEDLPSAQPNLQPTCNKLETDCISRQGVIDVLSQYPFEKVVNCISIIEEFPSAQSEIIRCKDCKHRCETEDGEYNPEDIVCAYWMSDGLSETDYCSHAERREDGTHSTNTNQSTGRLD